MLNRMNPPVAATLATSWPIDFHGPSGAARLAAPPAKAANGLDLVPLVLVWVEALSFGQSYRAYLRKHSGFFFRNLRQPHFASLAVFRFCPKAPGFRFRFWANQNNNQHDQQESAFHIFCASRRAFDLRSSCALVHGTTNRPSTKVNTTISQGNVLNQYRTRDHNGR